MSGEVRTWEKVKLAIESAPGCNSRTGCSSTLVGNDMYIFGGQEPHSGTLFNDILKIDLKTLTLSRVDVNGGSPPPRHSHISVLLNDKCLVSAYTFASTSQPFRFTASLTHENSLSLSLSHTHTHTHTYVWAASQVGFRGCGRASSSERHLDIRHRDALLDVSNSDRIYTTTERDAQRVNRRGEETRCVWRKGQRRKVSGLFESQSPAP